MSSVYELIGRLVVAFIRARYGRQLQIAGGVALTAGALVAYLLASRDVEEG